MIEARHAELGGDPALALDVDLARLVVADQHGGEAGLQLPGGDKLGNALANALAQAERMGLAVDQACLNHAPASTRRCGSQAPPARRARSGSCCAPRRP